MGAANDDDDPEEERPAPTVPSGRPAALSESCDAALTRVWLEHGRNLIIAGIWKEGLDREDAEDVAQIVLARMYESWSTFDGGNLAGWMWTLWHYEVRTRRQTRRRQAARQLRDAEVEHVASYDDTASPFDIGELRAALEAAREELNPVECILFDAMGAGNMSEGELIAQIAAVTDETLSGVALRKRRERMRARLQKRLALLGFP